ncbi:SusD/RagB family nutrient-binding outer membrane lipoprotein [uncultured Chryseobacterium sp.]|uniref:SusD/RagB family nutrient-binding outer membrane lipoprotein n=1 Tax=uncultured Chryseobacterium sp. TaxID=259322 RepID=UPI002615DED4|nr:SusD/RagB family nutrient-binding outer membrane lipoprotein [uncultured Chryseobacterium sp.]
MRKLKIVVLSLFVLGSLGSCRDENFGDLNKDKYGAYDASYSALMSGSMMSFAQNGGNSYLMNPQLYVQYQAQSVYTTQQIYGFERGAWGRYYANQIVNLDKIIADYSNNPTPAMLTQGAAENMIGVSKIFKSIIYKRITDTYGDIPYSEAAKIGEGLRTPKYDTQEAVYKGIIKDLQEGRNMLNTAKTAVQGDILYQGSTANWKRLANSVLLQTALQLSKKYPGASGFAAQTFNEALSNSGGVIETTAQEAYWTFSSASLVANPLNTFRAADYYLSREFTESLKGAANTFNRTSNHTLDKRLSVFSTGGNTGTGLAYGYTVDDLTAAGLDNSANAAQQSTKFKGADAPMALMTAGYTYLNRAEAAQLGWTAESATAMLTLGITRSYQTLDAKYGSAIAADAVAYAAARVVDYAAAPAKVIAEEKWVALFNQGFDSWSEWRRTGYPTLLPAHSAINGGKIPTRMPYPLEEANYNATNYNEAVSRLSPAEDKNTSKFWWEL